jgi:hypothetical protein
VDGVGAVRGLYAAVVGSAVAEFDTAAAVVVCFAFLVFLKKKIYKLDHFSI